MSVKIPPGKVVALDVETTGLSWRHGDQWYCLSFCNLTGDSAIVSFPVDPKTRRVTYRDEDLDKIRRWAANKKLTIVAHNAAFDIGFLKSTGIEFAGTVVCTMNLIRLHKSSERTALKPFCEKYFDIPNQDEEDVKLKTKQMRRIGKKKGWKIYQSQKSNEQEVLAPDYWMAGPKYYEPYCQLDSARAMMIYKHLIDSVEPKQWRVEMETWKVLRKIENRGIRVFKEKVLQNKFRLKKKRHFYLQKLNSLVGWINPNSAKQLCKLFYTTLKIQPKFFTKKNNPSIDVNALKAIRHPAAKTILNIRACEKTTQFMNQYLQHMVQAEDKCWYIHPRFHQAIALTGRESSSDPNLQQVAKGKSDNGIQVRVEARSVFGPRPGFVMRSYDYSGQEVYIPAYKSGDKKLISILSSGGDVHNNTSASLTSVVKREIDRDKAKTTYFSIQYGTAAPSLAKKLGVPLEIAEIIIYGFQKEYPDLWSWMEDLKLFIRRHGYIETAYGRKIEVGRGEEYKGINYYVQGTAGGVLKSAKVKIDAYLEPHDGHIVIPVHDEVLAELRNRNLPDFDRNIISCMQDNPELKMPINIPVSVSAIGANWAEKTKVGTF